jgi:hypothetical protein
VTARPYQPPLCRKDGAQALLRRRYTLSAWRPVWQCPACLRVRQATLGRPLQLMSLSVATKRRREKKPNARGRAYKKWLDSKPWRDQAKRVLRIRRYRCELRFPGVCTYRATQVHHRTYERFGGEERDSDLMAVCRECNLQERETRIRRRVLGG